jgi:hypothetical protein
MKTSLIIVLSVVVSACGLKEAKLRDEQNVKQLIAERGPELNQCYEAALKKNPKLEAGSITVRADQHIDGSLHSTRLIRGFSASNEILECVRDTVESWKTEAPSTRGPVTITWSFSNKSQFAAESRHDFEAKFKQHEEEFKGCYKQYVSAERNPEWGKIRFAFVRGQNGKVNGLKKIEGFRGSDQVFQCMSRIMESWQLAETGSNQNMTWSYQFRPDSN